MRSSVLLGMAFAALLLVVGGASIAVWTDANSAQDRVGRLHEAHMASGAALGVIRSNVYRSAILTRDYLLDADPAHAAEYVQQFTAIRTGTEEALRVLESPGQDDDQRTALKQLRKELAVYWDPTEVILDWTPAEKRSQRSEMLRQGVKRRREVVGLAAQLERMMTANYLREQQRINTTEKEFRTSLAWTIIVALVLGLGIAAATLARIVALEKKSYAAESELRSLSGQLRTAQEQERKHLSRELHDQVGQMLTGLRMELAGMARMIANSQSELSSRIAGAKGTVEQTLRIVRNIAMLLRPSMLDDLGLSPALAWLAKEVARSSGIEIKIQIDNRVDSLPEAHRTCIYRLVQEALTNVSQHSGAKSAQVTVDAGDGWVTGSVTDDGRGFDVESPRRKGIGLLGMEERVRELGGSIRVNSAVGSGTRIEMRLPRPALMEVELDTGPDCGRSRDSSGRVETAP